MTMAIAPVPRWSGDCMDMIVENMAGGVTRIVLQGHFDTTSAVAVEPVQRDRHSTSKGDHRPFGRELLVLLRHPPASGRRHSGGKLVMVCPTRTSSRS